jgi:hypothetical protein
MNNDKKDLNYWKENAEENYMTTPISVLKYITELEKHIEDRNRKNNEEWMNECEVLSEETINSNGGYVATDKPYTLTIQ